MPTSCWMLETSFGLGDTGGVAVMLSEATCWTGWTMAGVVLAAVGAALMSMGMEVVVEGGMVRGAEVLELSWKGLSLSMRSVLVPDTGRLRSFSSSFSSATCED